MCMWDDFDLLYRARYPILLMETYEEDRVIGQIKNYCKIRSMNAYFWTITQGMVKLNYEDTNPDQLQQPIPNTNQPEMALGHIHSLIENDETGIIVMLDAHPYLESPVTVRSVRDIVKPLTEKGKLSLVFVQPDMKIPMELKKSITPIDFALPSKDELTAYVDDLVEKHNIDIEDDNKEEVIRACLGLTMFEVENVLFKSYVKSKGLEVEAVIKEKEATVKKEGFLEYYHSTEKFSDIGGYDLLKNFIMETKDDFSQKARDFGIPEPKGLLMSGIWGCGKTLTAKAIASMFNYPLLSFNISKVMGGIVGESEKNMDSVLRLADSVAPCVLMIDEVEKALSGRESSGKTDGGTTDKVYSLLLKWLQDHESQVYVVMTANDTSNLDPALIREGRIDAMFFVDLPNTNERKEIFEIHIRKRGRDPENFDLDKLSKTAKDYTGSEIEGAVIRGLRIAKRKGWEELNTSHIVQAIKEAVPLSKTKAVEIEQLREMVKLGKARRASSQDDAETTTSVGRNVIE